MERAQVELFVVIGGGGGRRAGEVEGSAEQEQ